MSKNTGSLIGHFIGVIVMAFIFGYLVGKNSNRYLTLLCHGKTIVGVERADGNMDTVKGDMQTNHKEYGQPPYSEHCDGFHYE